jgi:hypothetical protein
MTRMHINLVVLASMLGQTAVAADKPTPTTAKEALKAFNDLIGSWRATGTPEGTRQEKLRGFWTETMNWEWQFKGSDAWLKVRFDKGKYFSGGELRYLPEKNLFQFTLQTPAKETMAFTGPLKNRVLTVERLDDKKKEMQRLVFTLLHSNRFIYRYEVKPPDRHLFVRLYEVGVTKDGEAFAGPGNAAPECIVSGGLGTIRVTFNGKDYYVCCSGCRTAFKEEPEKFIKEFEEKQKSKSR